MTRNIKQTAIVLILLFSCIFPIRAQVFTNAGWDNPEATFDGWEKAGITTFWEYKDTGGNPNGFVLIYGNNVTGMRNRQPDYTGNFAERGINTVSVDIKVLLQQLPVFKPEIFLRNTASFPAWNFPISNFTTQAGIWQHFDVTFDPGWTDEEAILNGWRMDDGPLKSFAETCSDVRSAGIKGAYPPNTSKEIGYDNFALSYTAPPAGPDTIQPMQTVPGKSTPIILQPLKVKTDTIKAPIKSSHPKPAKP